MPRGSGVVRYSGKRGVVWRIKYSDADGRQVMETVGSERDGVTRRIAEAELRERLVRVERKAYRKPQPITFEEYAWTWFDQGQTRRAWRPSSVQAYRCALHHLIDTFGPVQLARIHQRDVAAFVADASKKYAPKTIQFDLNTMHDVLKCAMRDELIDRNVVALVERPKVTRRKWRILKPAEIPIVIRSFTDDQARTIFLTLVLTGVRRHELQNLRWRDVDLVDMLLRVTDSKTEEGSARSPCRRRWPKRSGSTVLAPRSAVTMSSCSATRGSDRRSTRTGTPRCSGRRSRSPGSPTTCVRSTTCGTRP